MSEDREPPFPELEAAMGETLTRFTLDRDPHGATDRSA